MKASTFIECGKWVLILGLAIIPFSSRMGASGQYYHFGWSTTALVLKYGRMDSVQKVDRWYVRPRPFELAGNVACSFLIFAGGEWLLRRMLGIERRPT